MPAPMQDLLRDWRRWSAGERLMGIALVVVTVIAIPTAIVVSVGTVPLLSSGGGDVSHVRPLVPQLPGTSTPRAAPQV